MSPIAVGVIGIYMVGLLVGLVAIDARGPARLGLALAWPLGPLAFLVTISILLCASLIAFPLVGAIVLIAALTIAAVTGIGD